MADLTLCKGHNCPLKNECKRFLSKGDDTHNYWFFFIHYSAKRQECEFFIPVEK